MFDIFYPLFLSLVIVFCLAVLIERKGKEGERMVMYIMVFILLFILARVSN